MVVFIKLRIALCVACFLLAALTLKAAQGQLWLRDEEGTNALRVLSEPGVEWRFQTSTDLSRWTNTPALGSLLAGAGVEAVPLETGSSIQFIRATPSDGLFDTNLIRAISLTFTNPNWQVLLANGRITGSNVSCTVQLENGITISNVGARYKGNSSYDLGGHKKSINLDINWSDQDARLMGYRTVNLNNAAGDYTMAREALYFNVMREYTPCPRGALARVMINGQYWGVYSMVDQLNKDLLNQWFSGNDGDRWRAPNIGSGGFGSAASALSYLGPEISRYTNHYELKSASSSNAWARLVHACDVLNNTPAAELQEELGKVFAVDRWLWFLALENVFVDDDSYWYKGADYSFYYEPESGLFHPVEHDGNEAFFAEREVNFNLSPVYGANSSNRPFLAKVLSIPELRERYLAHMRTVLDERFNPEYLDSFISHWHYLSARHIASDPNRNFSMPLYTNALLSLRRYVTNRHNYLTTYTELRANPPRIVEVRGPAAQPAPGDAPVITARVEAGDTNGIHSVWLYFRDKPFGPFTSVEMFDDGGHEDGGAKDRWYGAHTAAFPAGNKIHYYIEARSSNAAGTAAFSPARAEQQTFSYRVGLATGGYSSVVINELLADNSGGAADPQGDYNDWIELRNLTDQPLDLTGLYLTDNAENPRKWAFPPGTIIAPDGFLVIWADDNVTQAPGLHANFKLSKSGEELLLIDSDERWNAVLDRVTFGPQATGLSFGRTASDPTRFGTLPPTPGEPNKDPLP